MKVVILCGGRGTRIQEVSQLIPKPLVEIGGKPILWHIMKIYAHYGFKDFVLCLGYRSWMFKEFFLNYETMMSDVEVRIGTPSACRVIDQNLKEDWRVVLAETGEHSTTAARIKRIERYVGEDEDFMVTYGDGLGNVDISALADFHSKHRKIGTVTGVRPLARFGELALDGDAVSRFAEKPQVSSESINGGFLVFKREFLNRVERDDPVMLEREPLMKLSRDGELMCFRHDDWWMPMDTPREYQRLNDLWAEGKAPWKVWDD